MKTQVILCDWAEAINGKLYIMGGGWSRMITAVPFNLGIAIIIKIPWNETNKKHDLEFTVLDGDGKTVFIQGPTGPTPIQVKGQFGTGRPMGIKPGSDLDATLAFRIGPIIIPPNDYVCELKINGSVAETVPFEGLPAPQAPGVPPQ